MSAISFAAFWAEMGIGWAMSWAEAHPGPFFVALGVAGAAGVFAVAARFMARDDMPLSGEEQETLRVFEQMTAELHHDRAVPAAPVLVEHAQARHARPPAWRRLAGRARVWWKARRALAPAQAPPLAVWHRTWAVDALAGQILMLPAPTTRLALSAPLLPAPSPAGTGDGPAPVGAVTLHVPSPAVPDETPGSGPAAGLGTTDVKDRAVHAARSHGNTEVAVDAAATKTFVVPAGNDPGGSLPVLHTDVPGRAPATAHTPGPPTSPAREGSGADPAGDTDESPWPHDTSWYTLAAIEAAVMAGEARR